MSNEKGSITILLSLIATVILTIGLGFNWLVKEHIRTSEGLKEKAEAILKARAAYDTIIYLMLTGQMAEDAIYIDEAAVTPLKALPLNGTEFMIAEGVSASIQDSNGRLSLTALNPEALSRLIQNESDASTAAIVTASLLDWVDRDDIPRLNGAEARYYESQGLPYRPRNYEIQYLAEFQLIRGMSKNLYERLLHDITILPTRGFNPNTASDAVLKAFLNINDSGVASIRNYLKQRTIASQEELLRLTGKSYKKETGEQWFFPSYHMDVVVSAGYPRSLYRIKAGLSVGQALFYPYFLHYWQEE